MRIVSFGLMTLLLGACSGRSEPPAAVPSANGAQAAGTAANEAEINPQLLRRFKPVAGQGGTAAVTPEKVALGRMLFYETRLSKGQDLSCNSCHNLANHGTDGRATSVGHRGQHGTRNAPTVYNAATHIAQFWDGRAETVEEQAKVPILNPIEMASSEKRIVAILTSIPGYATTFKGAFPDAAQPITLDNVGDAIGAFERGLVTTSRWDQFIAGKSDALTAREKHGLRVFLDAGCMACHTGPQVGGSMFQRVGVMEPWPNQKDIGRGAITRTAADRMMFKVPSLKNIADTGPYFHDGSAQTLEDAIRTMGRYQVGVVLSEEDVGAIAGWMRSLTGTVDPAYIAAPTLPPGTERTPKAVLE